MMLRPADGQAEGAGVGCGEEEEAGVDSGRGGAAEGDRGDGRGLGVCRFVALRVRLNDSGMPPKNLALTKVR